MHTQKCRKEFTNSSLVKAVVYGGGGGGGGSLAIEYGVDSTRRSDRRNNRSRRRESARVGAVQTRSYQGYLLFIRLLLRVAWCQTVYHLAPTSDILMTYCRRHLWIAHKRQIHGN